LAFPATLVPMPMLPRMPMPMLAAPAVAPIWPSSLSLTHYACHKSFPLFFVVSSFSLASRHLAQNWRGKCRNREKKGETEFGPFQPIYVLSVHSLLLSSPPFPPISFLAFLSRLFLSNYSRNFAARKKH
jgi:hypothetical protein